MGRLAALEVVYLFFPNKEIDFSRKTVLETNGSSQPPSDKSNQHKKSAGEFKSVTGGLLEEVVSLISSKSTSDSFAPTTDK